MRQSLNRWLIAVGLTALGISSAEARSYIVVGNGGKLPAKLDSGVAAAGGAVTQKMPEIGIALVDSSAAGFSAKLGKLSGIDAVLPDVRWTAKMPAVYGMEVEADAVAQPDFHTTLVTDTRAPLQWGLEAIDAGTAWLAGYTGAGVRVAVLDSGVAPTHVDLAGQVNTALSTSFVSGEPYDATGTGFNHGTHVAGIIASSINGVGTVGVAPRCEIVAVKVLSAVSGSGSFGGIINGVYYAALIQSDVINMSLGAVLPRSGYIDDNGTPDDPTDDVKVGANEITALANALSRATTFAYQRGTTIIVSAGNDAIDRDHDGSLLVLPADCPHVICVSATGPVGWAKDPAGTDLDNLASYSNYGQSRITLAAPGGDGIYPGNDNSTVAGLTRPTWVFDMVFAPANRVGASNFYSWAAGTSMAAPHVAGVAALIIERNGGSMKPAHVEAALRASADDLGKPGNDDAYGAGRVNAGRAATQ